MAQTMQAPPQPRTTTQRQEHALSQLATQRELWLATGGESGPHMIPLSYVWDGEHITMATFEQSRTTDNVRVNGTARVAVGGYDDVTMIDGTVTLVPVADMAADVADAYARVSFDPRAMPGLVYLRFTPRRVQVWNGFHEFTDRTVMRDGAWLA